MKINFGLVGCGNIGKKRAISLLNNKIANLKIIIGPQKKTTPCHGLALSKKYKLKYSNSLEDIFHENLDAVIVSVPSKFVFNIVKKLIKKKINVLVEKPLGTNLRQAKILTDLSKKYRVILKTGFNLRFDDGIIKLKSFLKKK